MSDAPAYQRRASAWWELRSFLSKRLSHDDFVSLLAELHGPLDRWVWDKPPPSPRMAFDQKPKPRPIEMATDFVAAFARGKFDRQTNNRIEKFIEEILAIEKEDTVSPSVLMMQGAYNELMAEGLVDRSMTIKDRYYQVLDRLGREDERGCSYENRRGYSYENFRANVAKS